MAMAPLPEIAVSWVKLRPAVLKAAIAESACTRVEVPPTVWMNPLEDVALLKSFDSVPTIRLPLAEIPVARLALPAPIAVIRFRTPV